MKIKPKSSHSQSIDESLFNGEADLIIASCYENERPLQGLAGLMDWRLHGLLSKFLRNGILSGKPGETVYVPWAHIKGTRHILLVGAGFTQNENKRKSLPEKSIQNLRKNLLTLGIKSIALSKTDLGLRSEQDIQSLFSGLKGIEVQPW